MYVPRFFALSQQRFGVTDIKAPSAWIDHVIALRSRMDHVTALRQISVTAQCYSSIYLEGGRKIHLRGVRARQSKDTRRRAPQRVGERERAGFGSFIYMFISPWACPM